MYHLSKGLILKAQIHKEADKLLTLYTYEWGKLYAVAPGAKKIQAKLAAATEPVVESEFMFYFTSPTSRPKITGAKNINVFSGFLADWRKNSVALYCAEVCDKLTPLRSRNVSKYELLLRTWQLLEHSRTPWRIFIAFSLRFLKLSGYNFLEFIRDNTIGIPIDELAALKKLAACSGDDVEKSVSIDPSLELAMVKRLDTYLHYQVQRPFMTKIFWNKIEMSDKKLARCS